MNFCYVANYEYLKKVLSMEPWATAKKLQSSVAGHPSGFLAKGHFPSVTSLD